MKKQELIHLHGLLAQVQNHYERTEDTEVEHGEYASLGVKPTSIHKSKTDHKAAVFALADGLTDDMDSMKDKKESIDSLLEDLPEQAPYDEDLYSDIMETLSGQKEMAIREIAQNIRETDLKVDRGLEYLSQEYDVIDKDGYRARMKV
jgi:hypothetical protein